MDKLAIENEILGIGVGAPGFVDKETGMVHEAVNIGWKNFDLGNQLQLLSHLPVFVENDANLAALGENKKRKRIQRDRFDCNHIGNWRRQRNDRQW
ncbi:ROK family protein [Virgibacillus halophilus]|uniref:ROK family protein n=1 Tax=Tigheibacillus halophilus TaxID=361280 RepID=A0ABU5C2B5_9BACI|nr:ROK family protein [Virgibacillus halophilus]